ncbi:hypothetical protein Syun_002867 [Stephania yunnanensis]|uniref:Uncharacterized protein n=1 Tax=Stephania yunnanensis TaxID=152371 RepID=A0AAP0Q037_9MAGN
MDKGLSKATLEPKRPENGMLFSFSNQEVGFGFFGSSPEKPLPPPPPCVEVLSSEVESNVNCVMESISLDGALTLLKGRVNTKQVFALSNSDLVPGKYEGGLKLWEGSLDLVKTLHSEVLSGQLPLVGKRILEVGFSYSVRMRSWTSWNFCMPSGCGIGSFSRFQRRGPAMSHDSKRECKY